MPGAQEITFGRFRLDLRQRELRADGAAIGLKSRAFDILSALAAARGEVVTKDEIMAAVWPSLVVEESNIQVHISAIRKALGEKTGRPIHLFTVPGRGYRLAGVEPGIAGDGRASSDATPIAERPSIAALPFQNLSSDPDQDYFADGMVEDIITGLSRIKWLFVLARYSTFAYKDRAVDLNQVGRELGVRYILEGSMRKVGNRVRVTTQLIDATTGAHVWADRYDRALDDIFELQDEITLNVVSAIEPTLRQAEIERAKRKRPENIDAYDLYLRATALLRVYMPADADQALALLRQSLALQPDYPAAQAAAAWCYEVRYMRGGLHEVDKTAAIEHARAAIEAGADDAMTLATAGFVIGIVAHDYETAMDVIDRALELTSASAFALGLGSIILGHAGQTDQAIDYAERSLRLTPAGAEVLNPCIGLAIAYCVAGNFQQAAVASGRAAQANPRFSLAHVLQAVALSALGRTDEAEVAMKRVLELEPG